MTTPLPISISSDLAVSIGDRRVALTPAQGLDLAEDLARKSFRRALAEEAGELARADAVTKAKQ